MRKKYRKKPITIEAAQWDGTREGGDRIRVWISSSGHALPTALNYCGPVGAKLNGITICTPEGDTVASPGDYIIRGVQGEFYPCKPDIFELTYEQVDD